MQVQSTIALILLALVSVESALPLPSYISPCPRDALSECATRQAPRVLQAVAKGDRKYSVPPIDPFDVALMQISQPGISMNFTKMQLIGMSNSNIKNITIDEDTKLFRVDYFMPKVSSVAHVSLDADLRVIRLKGVGESRIDMFNVTGHWACTFTEEKHADGLNYLKFLEARENIDPTKVVFQFDNIVNGDSTLGDAVNGLLNENWKDVIADVKPSVETALAEMMKSAISGMARSVPIQNMFA